MLEQYQRLVTAANAKRLASLANQHPTWSTDVLVIPCQGELSMVQGVQCNAMKRSNVGLEDFADASCSAASFRHNGGALLLLGDDSSVYRQDFARYGNMSLGIGHATTTGRLLELGMMSWDIIFLSDAPRFSTAFNALPRNSYLEGVRGPVVVAPNICKQYECGTLALAFLDFPGVHAGFDWEAFFGQVAASIVAEYSSRNCSTTTNA